MVAKAEGGSEPSLSEAEVRRLGGRAKHTGGRCGEGPESFMRR